MPSTCCCVPGCPNRGGHCFPTDNKLRKAWIHAVKRGSDRFSAWEPKQHSVFCKSHLRHDDYLHETVYGSVPLHRRLKKGVVPSVFCWKGAFSPEAQAREERKKSRDRKRCAFKVSTCEVREVEMCVPEVGNNVEISQNGNVESTCNAENQCIYDHPITHVASTQTPYYPMFCIEKFMSDNAAYAGSTSDRQIVERSNLMAKCDPGDSIMADKGFNVQNLFDTSDVTINIPIFFKKKNRMSGETVIKDRKIASKRVHIERIIGLAKTYKVLTEPLGSTETKLASEIIFICFMLCNFRPYIVSPFA